MEMAIDDDYRRFCLKCGWNDPDFGCTCPMGEDLWQCELFIYYHPDEVEEFNKSLERVEDGNDRNN